VRGQHGRAVIRLVRVVGVVAKGCERDHREQATQHDSDAEKQREGDDVEKDQRPPAFASAAAR